MLPLVTAALTIAETTGLTSWIGEKFAGEIGAKAAKEVVSIAQSVTGTKDLESIAQKLSSDSEINAKVREAILEKESSIVKLYYADMKDARKMYSSGSKDIADRIADKIIADNLYLVAAVVAIQSATTYFLKDNPSLIAVLSTLSGTIIKGLLDERKEVTGFYFGSSVSEKEGLAERKNAM